VKIYTRTKGRGAGKCETHTQKGARLGINKEGKMFPPPLLPSAERIERFYPRYSFSFFLLLRQCGLKGRGTNT
jgi:hypothetical protein